MAPAQGSQPHQAAVVLRESEQEDASQDLCRSTPGDEKVKEFARNMRRDVCKFLLMRASKLTWIDHASDENSS